MKIVLGIPTYNGHDYLERVIPAVLKQGFHKIYILDDASTDDSKEVYKKYPQVIVVFGDKQRGPGANRNRILGQDLGDIVFFLDDDMTLETERIPAIVEQVFNNHPKLAVLGAQVLSTENHQLLCHNERERKPFLHLFDRIFNGPHLPEKDFNVAYKNVFWVTENAMAIKSLVFTSLGGFDEHFRYHEGPDLCRRARRSGYKIALTNRIKAIHTRSLGMYKPSQYPKFLAASFIWYLKLLQK